MMICKKGAMYGVYTYNLTKFQYKQGRPIESFWRYVITGVFLPVILYIVQIETGVSGRLQDRRDHTDLFSYLMPSTFWFYEWKELMKFSPKAIITHFIDRTDQ
jgi:hypothetical protein